jgi:hypothetical protein
LDVHPNQAEIRGILSRLATMPDSDLAPLAEAWHNTTVVAEARARALDPDAPLVVEVLGALATVHALFADEMNGESQDQPVAPQIVATAVKALNDAIVGAYAEPILAAVDHNALLRAWRVVYPTDPIVDPDLGIRAADVTAVLDALPRLAASCHDAAAASEWAAILATGESLDDHRRSSARDEAWQIAVATSRQRLWRLLQCASTERLPAYCPTCHLRQRDPGGERVRTLCADAACGLLVADRAPADVVDALTAPVRALVPTQRRSAEA